MTTLVRPATLADAPRLSQLGADAQTDWVLARALGTVPPSSGVAAE